jgi:hypothetical protein
MTAKSASGLATEAADAIRALVYATLPHEDAPGLHEPADVYETIAGLKLMAQRLPQAGRQVSGWLVDEYQAGRVAHDSRQDAERWVAEVQDCLDGAMAAAGVMESMLNQAHTASAGLKAAEPTGQREEEQ